MGVGNRWLYTTTTTLYIIFTNVKRRRRRRTKKHILTKCMIIIGNIENRVSEKCL